MTNYIYLMMLLLGANIVAQAQENRPAGDPQRLALESFAADLDRFIKWSNCPRVTGEWRLSWIFWGPLGLKNIPGDFAKFRSSLALVAQHIRNNEGCVFE